MKVAIVHYWLVGMRGGEKVIEELCELYPQADIFTHVVDPSAISSRLRQHRIQTTFIDALPLARKLYRHYLPLMPMALEQLDLRGYDLVISSESGPAKGVITGTGTLHICYCHSPMRYLWNMYHDYRDSAPRATRAVMTPVFHRLRMWDYVSAARVDDFVANSSEVARRIAKYYRRQAAIIHPPVDTASFVQSPDLDDFYLCCGQLVAYKRVDLAIEAFNRMGKRLVVIGGGEQMDAMRGIAGPTVSLLGPQSFEVLKHHYARCRALVFPGEEDFGIVPVEAMASGRPVIAYGRGGALDTVRDGTTGILFAEQSVDALIEAVRRYERAPDRFVPGVLAAHARQFDRSMFRARMAGFIQERLAPRGARATDRLDPVLP